jgi:hypothetical protein
MVGGQAQGEAGAVPALAGAHAALELHAAALDGMAIQVKGSVQHHTSY